MSVLERISCHNFIEVEGYAYFSGWFYNGFFKVEIETGKTTFLGWFEEEKISQWNIHKEIFLRDDKIYMCPWRGRHLHIWNLADQTLCSVEIRKKEECSFSVYEICLGESSIFFLPDHEDSPIRKMDLESLRVMDFEKEENIQGKYLSESKDVFPESRLIETWGIEYADRFFWRKISGIWYAFLPLGHHMLRYTEGADKLEMKELVVVNKEVLEEYLSKIRLELFTEKVVAEDMINIRELLDDMKTKEICRTGVFRSGGNIGETLWKCVEG